jgi:nickel/cobalt exporter
MRRRALAAAALVCLAALAAWGGQEAVAQARHPFAVGANEAGGVDGGLVGWLLSQQAAFHRQLSGAVRGVGESTSALWGLIGLSFAYGVFHAAGPGHGKAVIGSYMLANERALRRGAAIALGAAALQGAAAFLLVAFGALAFGATSARMSWAAQLIETFSYAAIFALGLWLVWRKGQALRAAWRGEAGVCSDCGENVGARGLSYRPSAEALAGARAVAAPSAFVAQACAHPHMPDPRALGDEFSWRSALVAMAAAGARPCSGAIVVLVFSLAQGVFWAGGLAVAAMSLGAALTTAGLAFFAVGFKAAALRWAGGRTQGRAMLALRIVELVAALVIVALGAGLLTGALATPGGA